MRWVSGESHDAAELNPQLYDVGELHYHDMIRYRVAKAIDMLMFYQSDIQEYARLDWIINKTLLLQYQLHIFPVAYFFHFNPPDC